MEVLPELRKEEDGMIVENGSRKVQYDEPMWMSKTTLKIVCCGKCKWRDRQSRCALAGWIVGPNDFCSKGEKK